MHMICEGCLQMLLLWYMPLKIQEMLQLCISIPQRQFLLNLCQQNYLA